MPEVRDELKESLSALMDGESNELEKRQILAALSTSEREELLKIWNRYQISSAIIRGENLLADTDYRNDISSSISGWSFDNLKPSYALQDILKQFGLAASVAVITILLVQKFNGASVDRNLNALPAQKLQVKTQKEDSIRHPAGFKPSIDAQTVSAEMPRLKAVERKKSSDKGQQVEVVESHKSSRSLNEAKNIEEKDGTHAIDTSYEEGG